jgi:hypothetical protein
MSDIIVRIPQRQLDHFYYDKMESPIAFWRFAHKPKQLHAGDFIWFTRPEGVIAGAQVLEVTQREVESDDPQGAWKATWKGNATRLLKATVADIQYAQQGYRYLSAAEQRRLRQAPYQD